jgi:Spy/CpxP family protein refolding chaperone
MWKRIAPLLVILSVAINVAFISFWGAHVIREHGHHGTWFTDRHDEAIWCPLHRKLGTSKQQWTQIEPRLVEFRKASEEIYQDVTRKRAEMIDLLSTPSPDRKAIQAKQEEILAGHRRMQQLVIERLLAEKEVLTVEQQKELFDLLRQRSGSAGQMPMLGLQPDVSEPGDTTYSGAAPGHHDNQ